MSQMTSPEELFVHELQDMYYAEKTLMKVLPKLAGEATDRELSKAFTHHLDETRGQVENLERVFKNIGKSAQAQPCPGIEGIREEHDHFIAVNDPSKQMLDVHLTDAAARAEHYEIAAYTGLIAKARALGERESVGLLQENLRQEKAALKTVESISKRILRNSGNGSRGAKRSSATKRTSAARKRATSR